jgi:transcription-repair coupling factor (superfamily II helicase)
MEPSLSPSRATTPDSPGFDDLLDRVSGALSSDLLRSPQLAIGGLQGSSASAVLAAGYRERPGQWLVVAPDLASAEALCDDLEMWQVAELHYLPELEILPFDRKSPTRDILASVQSGLQALESRTPGFFVTTIYGLRHKVMSPQTLRSHRLQLAVGDSIDTEEMGEKLAALGYRPAGVVEAPGDMAVRGGLLDVYSPSHALPLRIELFGDEIESIRSFQPGDQRSRSTLEKALILPAGPLVFDDDTLLEALARVESNEEVSEDDRTELIERLQDRLHFSGLEGLAPLFHEQATYLDYLDPSDAGATVVWLSPDDLGDRARSLQQEAERVRGERIGRGDPVPDLSELLASEEEIFTAVQSRVNWWLGEVVVAGTAPAPFGPDATQAVRQVNAVSQHHKQGDVGAVVEDVRAWTAAAIDTRLVCDNRGQSGRITELLEEILDEGEPLSLKVEIGSIREGFLWKDAGISIVTDRELFHRYQRAHRRSRFRGTARVADPQALKPGDYCVHVDHGIARFLGLRSITADGIESECLLLEYADKDRLYVPTDNLLLVERYDIPEGHDITLHKLGGVSWERIKKKARKAILVMAQELLTLYAARSALPGFSFAADTHLQREMENSFLHEETPDQLTAVEAVRSDMERVQPMDRLVCGDVGFGKTEVAMRAAFKAVENGKQVAVLCPTTILAEQHGETFAQRMREFPVSVEVLSRFKLPKAQREVIGRTKAGKIDILIGTHRLLGRDVSFNDLGLLVVDEEQRFGVRHKERLKQMRKQVDVLTLSATPIPRTLHLALMGARDLSIIATPPPDRLPIHTDVVGFNEETMAEALRREMHRGGQVFFVHNRIETIDAMAALVQKVVPECSVLVAHGQMPETQLESIMRQFNAGDADVLVTTMIIESGLDMPNVNTILIDRADRFGLAQLHQLRGRVGRSRHQAYAYLMVPPGQTLSRDARARLAAIREFTDLGSGYSVALRDLEIRGSGNVLGEDQSGHIAAIGFELYCKMLEEEIRELKGEGLPRLADVRVDLRISTFLPDDYMADPEVKIRWYRELGRVSDERRLDALSAELADRFGALPEAAQHLVDLTRLKLRALEAGIVEVKGLRRGVRFVFAGDRCPKRAMMERLVAGTGLPSLTFHAVQGLQITADISREQWLSGALVVTGRLAEVVRANDGVLP